MKQKDVYREIFSWVGCVAGAIVLALLLRIFVFEFVRVKGSSMEPTLEENETVFMEKISVKTGDLKRFDIVIVRYPDRTDTYVKRLIAFAGETVAVKNGVLYVNEEAQPEDYTKEPYMYSDFAETVVPEGCIFVMGDNRNDSLDSRVVGAISMSEVEGRALFVVFPLSRLGSL